MSKALETHGCTCPSGDGSLRWPCPVHPALLPCPFFGASASGHEIEPYQHSAALLALVPNMQKGHPGSYVIGGDCQCGSSLIGKNQTEVIPRWNSRALLAHQIQHDHALDQVRQAVRDYHFALDNRGHGCIAADAAINSIETTLDIHWKQGQETGLRSVTLERHTKNKKKEN